jgi:GWxTD domain-containing protein
MNPSARPIRTPLSPRRWSATALLALAGLCFASQLPAQDARALDHLRKGLALAAAGDTASAVDELNEAVEAAPNLADAHYQLGRLLTRRASTVETEFHDRLLAEEALNEALQLDPHNPAYLSELGLLRVKQNMKTDARRLLDRALSNAEKKGVADSTVLANIHYNLGYIYERLYDTERDRRLIPPTGQPLGSGFPPDGSPFLYRWVKSWLGSAPPVPGAGGEALERMTEHYRKALAYNPGHPDAARRLLIHLLEWNQLQEYLSLAQRFVERHPARADGHLYLGMGLHAAAREDEAAAEFERTLALMPEKERAPYDDLAPVMRRRPAKSYRGLDERERGVFEEGFWRIGDPLYLTEANERRLEHWARVAYADLKFSEPATGTPGSLTDRGVIFIRYGPPNEIARSGGLIWTYDDGLAFMFRQTPGYVRTRFAGNYEWVANEYRHHVPSKYENIPSIPALLPVDVQLARFRGESPEELAVEIHAELPLEGLAENVELEKGEIETGLFLMTPAGEPVLRDVRTEVIEYDEAAGINPLRSWRVLLPSSHKLVAAVEARDATTFRSAASRDTFTATPFPAGSLAISDILLADIVRPLAQEPTERSELDIQPNPGRRFSPGQPVHIYYEIYDLREDREGFASYEVSLAVRVKELHREGLIADFLGPLADAWGFSIKGDDRVELEFGREVELDGRDRTLEFFSLGRRKAPPGEYEIILKVWDRLNDELATRSQTFTVVD